MSTLDVNELVKLCAVDTQLFEHSFFPLAARQKAPPFHLEMDRLHDDPAKRFVNEKIFRGGGKTTKCRMFTAKRIAYGMSRTILYVGASESHATRSIQWLRSAIESKRGATGDFEKPLLSSVFGLSPGRKWTDTEIEVDHKLLKHPIWVLGVGITGNIRGINFDNYRPDLIVLDDIITDENAATKEQREKICDLVLNALAKSLAPPVDEPNAKMLMSVTCQHAEDVSSVASQSEQWTTIERGCWTEETKDLPLMEQCSSWEERFPSPTLRNEKIEAIKINRLSGFTREMECRLTTPELCALRADWLQFREGPAPDGGLTVLAIDPVPPPSEVQLAKNLHGKNFEAQVVLRRVQGAYHVVDYAVMRGHDPNWSTSTALSLARRHRVARIVVETIGYQRVLKFLLSQAMQRAGIYYPIIEVGSHGQKKFNRITGALAGPGSHSKIFVEPHMTALIQQWGEYRGQDPDDILDALAVAMEELASPILELGGDAYYDESAAADIPKVRNRRMCP